jgi:hypothetical protein
MIGIEHEVHINRSPADVFEFLAHRENVPRWQASMLESQRITQGPLRLKGALHTQVRAGGVWLDVGSRSCGAKYARNRYRKCRWRRLFWRSGADALLHRRSIRGHFFIMASRFALNSVPGFHCGIAGCCATTYPTRNNTRVSSTAPLRSQSGFTWSLTLW